MTPLRRRLREETRAEHDRLDAAFGALDLSDTADYGVFLLAHHAAHDLIEPRIRPAPPRLDALRRDLDILGLTPVSGFTHPSLDSAHPAGLSYVVAGSYLGGQVLKRAWQASPNRKLHAAGHYFALPGLKDHWQAVLKVLKEMDPEQHDDVLEGARTAFMCFERALEHVSRGGMSPIMETGSRGAVKEK